MQYLKVVRYAEGIHQGFSLYEGQNIHVSAEEVVIERPDGRISIATEPGLSFYVMNDRGDTIDRFPWDWLKGSPERTRRVLEAAERLGSAPEALAIIKVEGGEIHVGRHVRESGAIATSINFSAGPTPWLMDDRTAGQLAHALLHGAFAPDAP